MFMLGIVGQTNTTCDYMNTFTGSDVRNNNDRQTQTYKFNCGDAVGDTVVITDADAGKVGHGISEVNIYGKNKGKLLKTENRLFFISTGSHHQSNIAEPGLIKEIYEL